jgi:deoxyribodipyrimidine photolyase-related protein
MKILRLLLGDQLSLSISALNDISSNSNDIVMLCEVMEEATYVRHHKLKIAFIFSAMRHFQLDLEQKSIQVHYVKLEDSKNTQSLDAEVLRAIELYKPDKLIVTEPGEYRVLKKFLAWQKNLPIPVEIRVDDRFYCSIEKFKNWSKGKKQLRMENFYHLMRTEHQILMSDDKSPIGGKWNYDSDNRQKFTKNLRFPSRQLFEKDETTNAVVKLIEKKFASHFGDLSEFYFAVNRKQALVLLKKFINNILPAFGDHQDMMMQDEAFMYHSILSPYLNTGLLLPREICEQAEAAYHQGKAPLNAVEGFIRQILGWREYIRGVYWAKMPDYVSSNYFAADRPLPNFYWGATTKMNCIQQVIQQTEKYAYAHHIQRLMITGNFALLAGISPAEVCEWYLLVYADAYEWVELPNTHGMALFADGGFLASKPYIASANYINKMSNYCQHCQYKPKETLGDNACPFNSLYWNFLSRHEELLKKNQRLNYAYAALRRMSPEKREQIDTQAKGFLASLQDMSKQS